ncbi:MAG: hypothetical protein JWP96_1737 [Polaromonas sp.]|nr:hypothetical protein [Polaromonas sp.]
MGMESNQAAELAKVAGPAFDAPSHDLDRQRLRILRCTAQAMASSPGGLRFKAGTRPWLEGIPGGTPASCRPNAPRAKSAARPAAN